MHYDLNADEFYWMWSHAHITQTKTYLSLLFNQGTGFTLHACFFTAQYLHFRWSLLSIYHIKT